MKNSTIYMGLVPASLLAALVADSADAESTFTVLALTFAALALWSVAKEGR